MTVVKVTKSSNPKLWYTPYIGKSFVVKQEQDSVFIVYSPDKVRNYIIKDDCEVVK